MKPGVYHDIPNGQYHGGPGLSNSGISDFLQSPYHYWARHLDPQRPPREDTQPQEDGTIAHCAILEPDEFAKRYVVGPDVSRATKAWKEFVDCHPDKVVIKPDQYTRALRQRDAVWRIPDVAEALSAGHAEASAYWEDPETGVLCRCRPDFAHHADRGVILIDVKTFGDARPSPFARQVARMGYHRQNAYYTDGYALASGIPVWAFIFVVVEMTWPYAARAHLLEPEAVERGRGQYRAAVDAYAKCERANAWPGYPEGIDEITLPMWAMEE